MLVDYGVGSDLSQSQISHYDPQTNRCYVEITVNTADRSKWFGQHFIFHQYLYDGQTKQMLAMARIEGSRKSGIVYDKQHLTEDLKNTGYDDASTYIAERMADDRR
jgi:hypothetical protein